MEKVHTGIGDIIKEESMQQRTTAGQQGKQQHRQTGHRRPAVDLHRRQPPVFVQPQSGRAGRFHLLLHHRGLYLVVKILLIHSLDNRLGHVVDHLVGHAGINADPEGVVHDKVGVGQLARHAVGVGAADLVKAGVLDEVAAKQQTGLHVVALHIAGHGVAVQAALRLDGDQEAEPGRAAVGSRLRQDQLVGGGLQARRRSQLWRRRSMKVGNFFSCSQPMAACMSVTLRL